MAKLFKLKEWLTLAEATRHPSIVFGEEVTEADVLRLGLDGHLKLSVNFVNHAKARPGRVIPKSEARTFPGLFSNGGEPYTVMLGTPLNDREVLEIEEQIVALAGVWDLPMIGSESLDVEHRYQQITGGPDVKLVCIEGAFVEAQGQFCQLQESWDDNEYELGSKAALEALRQHITYNSIGKAEAEKLLNQHEENRKEFLKKQNSRMSVDNYYPAGALPRDSALVVRREALNDLERRLSSEEPREDKPLSETERSKLLAIVLGMALASYGYDPTAKKNAATGENNGSIHAALQRHGLSVDSDTIRKYLAEATEEYPDAKPRKS